MADGCGNRLLLSPKNLLIRRGYNYWAIIITRTFILFYFVRENNFHLNLSSFICYYIEFNMEFNMELLQHM